MADNPCNGAEVQFNPAAPASDSTTSDLPSCAEAAIGRLDTETAGLSYESHPFIGYCRRYYAASYTRKVTAF